MRGFSFLETTFYYKCKEKGRKQIGRELLMLFSNAKRKSYYLELSWFKRPLETASERLSAQPRTFHDGFPTRKRGVASLRLPTTVC